jgi:hypothetical protein
MRFEKVVLRLVGGGYFLKSEWATGRFYRFVHKLHARINMGGSLYRRSRPFLNWTLA